MRYDLFCKLIKNRKPENLNVVELHDYMNLSSPSGFQHRELNQIFRENELTLYYEILVITRSHFGC